jgi:hypothetical protein
VVPAFSQLAGSSSEALSFVAYFKRMEIHCIQYAFFNVAGTLRGKMPIVYPYLRKKIKIK